jgi:hypothetical protein
MESLNPIDFLNQWGWWAVLAVYLLKNLSGIAAFVERALSRVWPSFAEQRRAKAERNAAAEERTDTIVALKEMLKEYRESLKSSIMERQVLQEKLYDVIAGYERLSTQTVEILRTINETIRSQTTRPSGQGRQQQDRGRNETKK